MKTYEVNALLKPVVRVNDAGSGIIVYSKAGLTLVLTNAHVVEDLIEDPDDLEDTPFVSVDRFKYEKNGKLIGYFRTRAEIVAFDDANDLAMLRLRDKKVQKHVVNLPTDDELSDIGVFDDVYIIGCPLRGSPMPSKGTISAINVEFDNKEYWMTSAPIVWGNSGGGCFKYINDNYVVIGVPTAVDSTMEITEHKIPQAIVPHLNYIVPPYRLRHFVDYVLELLLEEKDELLSDK